MKRYLLLEHPIDPAEMIAGVFLAGTKGFIYRVIREKTYRGMILLVRWKDTGIIFKVSISNFMGPAPSMIHVYSQSSITTFSGGAQE